MEPYLLLNTALVGAFALTAAHYLGLWWSSRREKQLLLFAVHNAFVGAFSYAIVGLVEARAIPDAQAALDLRSNAALLVLMSGPWVACGIAGARPGRGLFVLTGLLGLTLVCKQIAPLLGVVTEIQTTSLPWGETVSLVKHTRNPWGLTLVYSLAFASQGFVVRYAVLLWRRERAAGGVLFVASVLAMISSALGGLRDLDILAIPYPGVFAYAAWGFAISAQISRRHRLDAEALRENEARLRAINTNLPNSMTYQVVREHDGSMRLLYVGPSVEKLHGVTAEAVLADSSVLYGQILAEDRAALSHNESESLRTMTAFEQVVRFRGPDGDVRWRRLSSMPRKLANGRVLWDGIETDVTESKLLENQLRQAQKMEALGRLAGGVAHDFNNLLTVIGGFSHLLLTGQLDPKVRSSLEQIREAGERASALTRQLLAFTRRSVQEAKLLDLNQVVRKAEVMLRRLIGEDVKLIVGLAATECRVLADADQLGQVLINLAINARDAMPKGGTLTIATSLHVTGDRASGPPGRAVLSVRDTGIGMADEVRARMFEPFFTTKGPGVGTGLGLAVALGVVEQSQGSIEVVSEPDVGTTIRIAFPLVATQAEGAPKPDALRSPHSEPCGHTVLLVEDDRGVRAFLHEALETHGFDVVLAKSGEEATGILAERSCEIDVVLTDLVMPGMSGLDLAEGTRRSHPTLPFLCMSGYTDETVLRHGLEESDLNLLRKPFTAEMLVDKLRQTLSANARS